MSRSNARGKGPELEKENVGCPWTLPTPQLDGDTPRIMSLTTEIGVKAPQVVLGTLVKHYFSTRDEGDSQAKDELLYDQAFNLVKVSNHTYPLP
jgi:hypothetical protein